MSELQALYAHVPVESVAPCNLQDTHRDHRTGQTQARGNRGRRDGHLGGGADTHSGRAALLPSRVSNHRHQILHPGEDQS